MTTRTRRRITYRGGPMFASALVAELEHNGVHVQWQPPAEHRDLASATEGVVVSIVARGSIDAIRAAVRLFRSRFPRPRVDIEGDDDPEDDVTAVTHSLT
jgi:hypothetical protein